MADFRVLSVDAGMKYKGLFLQTEIYHRWLDNFVADGPLPVRSILDRGFFGQGAFYPIREKLELYAATSQIHGAKDAGFSDSSEYLGGLNFYPFAGEQRVRLLHGGPGRCDDVADVLRVLLDSPVRRFAP